MALFPAPVAWLSEHRVQLLGTAFRHGGILRLGRRRSESERREPLSMGRQRELDSRQHTHRSSEPTSAAQRFDTVKGTPFFGQEIYGATFTSSSNSPGSGLPFADFLLGYPSFIQGTPMLDWGRQRSIYFGGFVQDDWKITQKPDTESRTALRALHAAGGRPRPGQPVQYRERTIRAARTRTATRRAIVDGDHNNFGPRAGFAWQVTSQAGAPRRLWTVLRRARSESAGDAVLRQPAERSGSFAAQHLGDADGRASVHHQHADQGAARRPVAGVLHGGQSVRRNHPLGGFPRFARSRCCTSSISIFSIS